CGAMLLLLIGVFAGDKRSTWVTLGCVALLVVTAVLVAAMPDTRTTAFGGTVVLDGFARFTKLLVLAGSAIAMLMSLDYLRDEKLTRFEYPLLVTLATLGMLTMVSANDLIVLYVGLELQSLALYVLASFARDNARSTEAGLKYFVLGALSSGMLLYGASLLYGFTGSTGFEGITAALTRDGVSLGVQVGAAFVLAGLVFKISAVPFHMWTPDVYEGAPTPVTAFFAAAPKIAAMALIARFIFGALGPAEGVWLQILAPVSVASMIWGALAAIGQTNIKRLMAYSSISHMGYALIGFVAGTQEGVYGVLVYLVIYLAMTVGTFVCIMMMRRDGQQVENVSDLAGLSDRDPTTAYMLAILMFSLIGIPPLAGFFGKWYVFLALVHTAAEHPWMYTVAVVGLVTSVVGAYYYLNIVRVMFFDKPAPQFEKPLGTVNAALLGASTAFVAASVIVLAPLVDAASAAAKSLFP
ncbi:MAG: NADH-quinone oxidoreductase subunit NuoN, partial [Alphaproteobacteria bacterium]|nr:NADH-quinone oxidoreductase subunit NuoN [Alphaproteobacteria bacterium]